MKGNKKLSTAEIQAFCEQLSLLLPAGITPYDSILLMYKDSTNESEKKILQIIIDTLMEGNTFYDALVATNVFPSYMLDMIHLGEESGTLDVVICKLSDFYKQNCLISDAIRSALAYPLIMIGLMLIIMVVLLTRVLPIFNQVFLQLGSGLTGVAAKLMSIGRVFSSISGFIVVLAALLTIFAFCCKHVPSINKWFKHIIKTKGFTKDLFLLLSYSRFASALSIVTSAGLDIYKGLDLAKNLTENELLDEPIEQCKSYIVQGEFLHESMQKANIFNATQHRMLQIGHKSGTTDTVFTKISNYYSELVLKRIHSILSIIEPTLVIIFSMIVGLVLLSVIMPLIGIMTELG